MPAEIPSLPTFESLGLRDPFLQTVSALGYESPSPIQTEAIPPLLEGRDILGQAQTGSGKTAAFALPLLARLNLKQRSPQILVLAPTRELAIQVSEAFQKYAEHLKGFHVVPIYGGQDYRVQFRALDRNMVTLACTNLGTHEVSHNTILHFKLYACVVIYLSAIDERVHITTDSLNCKTRCETS